MTAMTAPLSLFLTRFSAPLPLPEAAAYEPPLATETKVKLTESELDARLQAAAEFARVEADRRHAAALTDLARAHEEALAEAIAMARAEWTETESKPLGAMIDAQLGALRDAIADRLAGVLRPWLTETVQTKTIRALTETIDRLLADPSQPAIRVCGSEDLLAALREARPAPGIEWVGAYQAEVTVTTNATSIETRLAAALAEITASEG